MQSTKSSSYPLIPSFLIPSAPQQQQQQQQQQDNVNSPFFSPNRELSSPSSSSPSLSSPSSSTTHFPTVVHTHSSHHHKHLTNSFSFFFSSSSSLYRFKRALLTCILLLLCSTILFLTCFTRLLHTLSFTSSTSIKTSKPCNRAIVFSGARQGSTWFIDSIEYCMYSLRASPPQSFTADVFQKTELWKHFGDIHHSIPLSSSDALDYIVSNSSVKIFPSVFWNRKQDIIDMIVHAREKGIVILVLRRSARAAWKSWLVARATDTWIGNKRIHDDVEIEQTENKVIDDEMKEMNKGNNEALNSNNSDYSGDDDETIRNRKSKVDVEPDVKTNNNEHDEINDEELIKLYASIVKLKTTEATNTMSLLNEDLETLSSSTTSTNVPRFKPKFNFSSTQDYHKHFKYFSESKMRFEHAVQTTLNDLGVVYDVFDYDVVRKMPIVLARNSGCWIANCNFDPKQQVEHLNHLGILGGAKANNINNYVVNDKVVDNHRRTNLEQSDS